MSLARKVAYNTIIQVIGKVISTFLGLIAIAIMTRYLGSAGFGQYTTVITFVSIFAIVADLGLTLVASQLINRPDNNESEVLGNLLSFRLLSAGLLVGLAPVVVWLFPYGHNIKMGVLITSLAFFFLALNQIFVSLFQKHLCTERMGIAEVTSRVVVVLGVLWAKQAGAGLNGMLWAVVASNFVNFLLHWWLSRSLVKIKLKFSWLIWQDIMKRSWPLLLTITFNLIYLKADLLLLSLLQSEEAVGWYGAAYKVVDVLVTVPFLFAGLMLPIMVKYWTTGLKEEYYRVLQRVFDFTAIMVVPLMWGGLALAKPIVLLIAGPDFIATEAILKILLLAVGAVFFSCFFTHVMVSLERQKNLIIYYLITALTALPIYYWGIVNWSYYGAAWGTVYSESLILLFAIILVRKYGHWGPRLQVLGKTLLASLVMYYPLSLLSTWAENSGWQLLLVILLGMLIYGCVLYGLKGFAKKDLLTLARPKANHD